MNVLLKLLTILLLTAPGAVAQGVLDTTLESAFLVKGEPTSLILHVVGHSQPSARPTFAPNPDLGIRFDREGLRILPKRRKLYMYTFTVQSFKTGTHQLPVFHLTVDGVRHQSRPIPIRVAPLDELTFGTRMVGGEEVPYYSAVFTPDKAPYRGEAFPAELKIYVPESAGEATAEVAELDHRGLTAWRFESIKSTPRVSLPTGNHLALTYRSTVAPIRSGEVTLGPGRARAVITTRPIRGAFDTWDDKPVEFDTPARKIEVLPLPPGAPDGFDGAVGSFTVDATAETNNLEEGDPISVRLTISGRGNLDTVPAPILDAPPGEWKLYEPSRLERQDERRSVSGQVRFSQIIRPLARQQEIPAFQLAYFNPVSAGYETARTKPIPFSMRPGKTRSPVMAITPTLATPVEDMQGILGLVDPLRAAASAAPPSWLRYWQLVPVLLGLVLIARLGQRHVLPRFRKSDRECQVLASLDRVAQSGPDLRDFLRAAGHFIERWIPPTERSEDLQKLIEQRDTDCYRPGSGKTALEPEKRGSVLQKLKSAALAAGKVTALLLIVATALAHPADAKPLAFEQAEEAWTEGNFRIALDLYTNTNPGQPRSANLLYNIGNCHFQLGEPGKAALFYHRALLRDPRHPEANQNLRYLERTHGSIVITRAPYERLLAKLDRGVYRAILAVGAWSVGLCALAFFALVSRFGRFLVGTGFVGGCLLSVVATVALSYYPDDAEFAALEQRGIVTSAERIEARTEASVAGKSVIEAPPGSVCRILAPRGPWTYVEFANLTRGWLPTNQVTPLAPPAAASGERL